jgi:hypothetical protein
MNKYILTLEIECEEKLGDVDNVLEGCMLYESDFQGAITKSSLKQIK